VWVGGKEATVFPAFCRWVLRKWPSSNSSDIFRQLSDSQGEGAAAGKAVGNFQSLESRV